MAFEAIAWLPIGLPGPRADHSGGPPDVNVPLLASSRVRQTRFARPPQAPKPDLVILDVRVPILDGISAAEWVAAQQIAPVVILTACSCGRSRPSCPEARQHPGHPPRGHPGCPEAPPAKY
jgi:CheY-like chemotaxis protein